MTVDELAIIIKVNQQNVIKEINKISKSLTGMGKTATSTTSDMISGFKKLIGISSKLALITLAFKVVKNSIKDALDYIAGDQVYLTTMGDYIGVTKDFTQKLKDTMGISRSEMRKFISVIYNMSTSMGIGDKSAYTMSKNIAMLSQDLAAFWNISTEDALSKLQSGLSGNTMALKQLGITVNEATIKQVAYENGIAKQGATLTEAQKVAARYIAIMNQTGNVQKFLANTINSPNAQLRMLNDSVKTMSYTFGQLFIPILSVVLPYLNAFVKLITLAIEKIAGFFGIKTGSDLTESMAKVGDGAKGAGALSDNLGKATGNAKKLKGTLAGFDEMTVLQEQGGSGGGSTGALGRLFDFTVPEYDWSFLEGLTSKADEIANNLNGIFKNIGKWIKEAWDSAPVQAWVKFTSSKMEFIKTLAIGVGTSIVTNLSGTWKNIEGDVKTITGNLSTLMTSYWTDLADTISTYTQPVVDGIVGLFNSVWTDVIDPTIKYITTSWAGFTGSLVTTWDKYGKPILDKLGQFAVTTIGIFQSIWDKIIAPIFTPFLEMLSWLWDTHISGLVDTALDTLGKLIVFALDIYNEVIAPIIHYLIDILSPIWSTIWDTIALVLGMVFAAISNTIKIGLKIFGGIIDFLDGIFTGDWDKVWSGIKEIFGGVWEAIKELFKIPINWIIDGINKFIDGLNNIKIPDWVPLVGGKGFKVERLKRLAAGGIVEEPMVALIGEAGREAVMPLDRNTGWMDELAAKINAKGSGNSEQPIVVNLVLENEVIGRVAIDTANERAFQLGEAVFHL